MTTLVGGSTLASITGQVGAAVVLSLPSSRPSIERIQASEPSSQFKNFLKIAPTFIENLDKIVLTDKQIEQFDLLGQQVIRDSITMEEAVLQIRGGDRHTLKFINRNIKPDGVYRIKDPALQNYIEQLTNEKNFNYLFTY